MASPWGKPRNWDLGAKNLIHRGTGISTYLSKESSGSRKTVVKYGPGDWRKSSSSLPASHYGTLPRRNTSCERTSVLPASKLARSSSAAVLPRSNNLVDNYSGLSRSSSATFKRGPPPTNAPLLRSYSTATLPRNSKLASGLSRSSSGTFGRDQQPPTTRTPSKSGLSKSYSTATLPRNSRLSRSGSGTFEQGPKPIKPGMSRSYSTATLPRNTKLASKTSEDMRRELFSGPLRRSGSNDFGSTGNLRRTGSDAALNKSSSLVRSSSMSSVARTNSRDKGQGQTQAKKRHPPVAIKNMNIRGNQMVRSQSTISPPPRRDTNRSRSTSMVNKPTARYVKYVNGYAIPCEGNTGSDTSSFSRSNSLRRSTGQMGKRHSQPQQRIRVISSEDRRHNGAPRNTKPTPRYFDNPLSYDEYEESTDATDNPDETSFPQISSDDEPVIRKHKPKKAPEGPSLRELWKKRGGPDLFPQARSMTSGRRNCMTTLHQISHKMERPPTARELSEFYKDPVMTPKPHLVIATSETIPQRTKGTKTPRQRKNSKIPLSRNRRSSFNSSSDESSKSSIMSFLEYEARFMNESSKAKESSSTPDVESSKRESSSLTESSLSSGFSSSSSAAKVEKTNPAPAQPEDDKQFTVTSLKQFFEVKESVPKSESSDSDNTLSSEEKGVIAELHNILQHEELIMNSDSSSSNVPTSSADRHKLRDGRFLSLFSEKHEQLIPDHEIKSDIKLLTSTSGSDDVESLNSDRMRIAQPVNTDLQEEESLLCGASLTSLGEARPRSRSRSGSSSPADNIRPIRTSMSEGTMAYLQSNRTSGDGVMNSIRSSIGDILEKASPYIHYKISEESSQDSDSSKYSKSKSNTSSDISSHKKPPRRLLSSPVVSKSPKIGDATNQKLYYRTVVIDDESSDSASYSSSGTSQLSDTKHFNFS